MENPFVLGMIFLASVPELILTWQNPPKDA